MKWIRVDEKLPGPFDTVLISIESVNGYGEPASWVSIGGLDHGVWQCFTGQMAEVEKVIAWMPLPDAYEEGNND